MAIQIMKLQLATRWRRMWLDRRASTMLQIDWPEPEISLRHRHRLCSPNPVASISPWWAAITNSILLNLQHKAGRWFA
jgi:hypothetical protein